MFLGDNSDVTSHNFENDACELPFASGYGPARIPSYYYDQEQSACLPFIYGGFGGNANRFKNVYECEIACIIRRF
ncbi:unnamed protein product [Mesocestoides corti]|uniref:BPTI/Kunitz inhibitor domain-containing protein n=1 Tax=Mesocestoides corti TaxID=53468 RepID=A0A0R3UMQ9_MESCO|nr:unnamed protein product [Mesocestoides corti]